MKVIMISIIHQYNICRPTYHSDSSWTSPGSHCGQTLHHWLWLNAYIPSIYVSRPL